MRKQPTFIGPAGSLVSDFLYLYFMGAWENDLHNYFLSFKLEKPERIMNES